MADIILLADDSLVIQKLVGLSFANQNVELVTTDNGSEAISMARAHHPNVILADVVMPGLSGYEVCSAIKNDPELADIPVILLTRTSESFNEDLAHEIGANGHITKPFESQTLATQIQEILRQSGNALSLSPTDQGDTSQPHTSTHYPLASDGDTSVLASTSNHELLIEPLTRDEFQERHQSEEKEELPTLAGVDWNPLVEPSRPFNANLMDGPEDTEEWPTRELESAIEALLDEDLESTSNAPSEEQFSGSAPRSRRRLDSAAFDPGPTDEPNRRAKNRIQSPRSDSQRDETLQLSVSAQAQIREVVERVAWEAFSDLPQAIIQSLMERVERVAWEVIPQMAETLIREEIERMKGSEAEDDPDQTS